MDTELLDIYPQELKFTFEVKKQSSCSVHLINKTNEYVAFKVKTTSPKRYCVRPNTGVILPRSAGEFTVTMQAQKTAPQDMQLKDKFLVQSTVAPYGSADEDIVPALFSKETKRYVEESKLRVVLVSPPHSPELQPSNGASKQELVDVAPKPDLINAPPRHEPINRASKHEQTAEAISAEKETPISKVHTPLSTVENLPLSNVKEVEDLKLHISNLDSRIKEADKTIRTLLEEKFFVTQERDKLQKELVLMNMKCAARVQVGFPFLFVLFMALVGASLGYFLRP